MGLVTEQTYTADDLLALSQQPEYDHLRLDLIDGVLHMMSPASWKHGELAWYLALKLGLHVLEHHLGTITAAETGYILHKGDAPGEKDTVLAPDVGFVAADRLPAQLPEKFVPFAPDLAAEIVSPGDTADEVDTKVTTYLRYGTRLVWVIYPSKRAVRVYRLGSPPTESRFRVLTIADTIDGEDVVPGFVLPVRDLFGERTPTP